MPGTIVMQDVLSTDVLRKRLFLLKDMGAALADTTANVDTVTVAGLPDAGGTIVQAYGAAGTQPAGTTTMKYDVHRNHRNTSQTIFATRLIWVASTTNATAPTLSATAADLKVYNGDQLQLRCDVIGSTTAGSDISVTVEVRADAPND